MSELTDLLPPWLATDGRVLTQVAADLRETSAAFARGRLGLMIGSGASIPAGVPAGDRLAREVLEDSLLPQEGFPDRKPIERQSHQPFEVLLAALEQQIGRGKVGLEEYLRNVLYGGATDAGSAYGELKKLLETASYGPDRTPIPRTRRIFTTNFDTFIEETVGDRAQTVTSRNQDNIASLEAAEHSLVVIHFHGAITRPPEPNQRVDTEHAETLVATEVEMFSSAPSREMLGWRLIETMMGSDVFAFVGYSMSDANLRAIYHRFRDILTHEGKERRTLFVAPPDDPAEFHIAERVAETRHGHAVPLTAQQFFRQVRRRLERSGEEETLKRLSAHYGGLKDEDLEALIENTIELYSFSRPRALEHLLDSPNHSSAYLDRPDEA